VLGAGLLHLLQNLPATIEVATPNVHADQACAFLELVSASGGHERFGVGMDTNIVTASVKALLSGVNRLGQPEPAQTLPIQIQ